MKMYCMSKVSKSLRMASMSATRSYSVLIGGGGMVGNALALATAKSRSLDNRQVLVLEAGPKPKPNNNSDLRVSALNNSSKSFLDNLQVFQNIPRTRRVLGMNTWSAEDGSSGALSFRPSGQDEFHLFMVHNDDLVQALNDALSKCGNVDIRYDTKIKGFEHKNERIEVTLEGEHNEVMSVDLLVGADGHNSMIRRRMSNNKYISTVYNQMGLVANLAMEENANQGTNNVAWQKFTRQGPIALLPMGDSKTSLVWSQPSVEAQRRLRLSADEFVLELNTALGRPPPNVFEESFPSVKAVENRAAFPLGLGHALRYVEGGRVALVGDAAHRVHPLAGQGLNLGLGDVAALVRHLEEGVLEGSSTFPNPQSLLDYETERQRHNLPMLFGIDALHRIYSCDNPLVKFARTLGIRAVNEVPGVKKFITAFVR